MESPAEMGALSGHPTDGTHDCVRWDRQEHGIEPLSKDVALAVHVDRDEEVDRRNEQDGLVVQASEHEDQDVEQCLLFPQSPEEAQECEAQQRGALLQVVTIGQGHKARHDHDTGQGLPSVEPLGGVPVEQTERSQYKHQALDDVGKLDTHTECADQGLGNEELEQSRLLVVEIREIEQVLVVARQGSVEPGRRVVELQAQVDHRQRQAQPKNPQAPAHHRLRAPSELSIRPGYSHFPSPP